MRTDAAIVIRRPAPTVFRFVADAENVHRFRPEIVAVRRTSGAPTAVGATYHQLVKLGWRPVEVVVENTEYEPEQKLSFIAYRPDGGTITTAFSFQRIEREHTRLRVTTEGPTRPLGRLARSLQKREVEALRHLKQILESRPPDR